VEEKCDRRITKKEPERKRYGTMLDESKSGPLGAIFFSSFFES
jgi:hypothetical protein